MSAKHSNHKFCLVSECFSKHRQDLEAELELVKEKVVEMDKVVSDIASIEEEVTKQEESIKDDIETYAQQLMELIQVSKVKLFSEVQSVATMKRDLLARQRAEAEKLLKSMKECEAVVQCNIQELSQGKILMKKRSMMNEMRRVSRHVDPAVFRPIETADVKFGKNLSFLSDEEIGEFVYTRFDKALVELGPCVAEKLSTTTLTLKSHDGEPFLLPSPGLISCKLVPPGSSLAINCSVSETGKGEYDVSYTLSARGGEHILMVQVGGVDIKGSPFTLRVPKTISPTEKNSPLKTISKLSQPRGIAVCDDNNLLVVENTAHCVTMLDQEGDAVKTFGKKGVKSSFIYPHGVAVYKDGIVFVTDEHRLHKLDTNESCIVKTVGKTTAGSGETEFRNPHDIAIHPSTCLIFVADSGNNRIQVFTDALSYSHTIKNYRYNQPKTDCLNEPIGLAFDKEGDLYISEYLNHCITKVTPQGQFIAKIGSEGSDPGELYGPSSITIHQNYIYVAELGIDRVSVFDCSGEFVHCFWNRGKDNDSSTYSVTVDQLGNLYVTDNWNSVVVY